MPVMIVDMRRASWGGAHPGGFIPNGKIVWSGPKSAYEIRDRVPNPVTSTDVEIPAVRFFVGFSVGTKSKWTMTDLMKMVKQIRVRQRAHPDATFVAQHGMYSYRDGKNRDVVVTEKGAQVVILNMPEWDVPQETFRRQMEELGMELCRRLKQELIVGEWQINGEVRQTWKVTP